jgi:formate C-acetyltransferase
MDIIAKGFSQPTKRIELLKETLMNAKPTIEADRAVIVMNAYKKTEAESPVVRRAITLEAILDELPITIRDQELIVGSLTKIPRSTQIFPEFSNKWLMNEFESLAKRGGDAFEISDETKAKLTEVCEYFDGKTTQEYATSLMSAETKMCMEAGVFTVGNYYFNGVGHVSVDYAKVLKKGFKGIMAEVVEAMENADKNNPEYLKQMQFWKAVIITSNAAINFAKRYSKLAKSMADATSDSRRKQELLKISEICNKVPENPATTFYEACQSFWFVQAIMQIESNGHSISPCRFDQYMNPYLEADKSITEDEALELLDCLTVKFNDVNKVRDEVSTKAFGGYPMFQNMILGGQTPGGLDATNRMSYLMLESIAHVRMAQPSISLRVWSQTPDEFLFRAAELSRIGLGMPAYYNDEVVIPALTNRGVTLEDARDYGIIGCVEPQKPGKTEGWHDAAFFNMAKVLEFTMNNGVCPMCNKQIGPKSGDVTTFTSFDQFMEAFRKQMEFCVYHLCAADNCVDIAHGAKCPLPFLSSMVEDCISVGKSATEGGAHYNFTGPQGVGVANVGDSLMGIKKFVFDEGRVTMAQMKEAIDSNFGAGTAPEATSGDPSYEMVLAAVKKILAENSQIDAEGIKKSLNANPTASGDLEQLRLALQNEAPKFGNDADEVDMLAREGALIYCSEVQKYRNPRGGQFQAGLYPVSINVLFGTMIGATPDGRKAGEPLADGVSPVRGADTNGPTAATNSVAKLDHFIASNGTLLNQKFHPGALQGDEGVKNLAALIRSYFDRKGMHVQFNVVDRDTLLAAQKNPEQYRDLVVRVAGYSAQFISLDKAIQDDIIMRTEHTF